MKSIARPLAAEMAIPAAIAHDIRDRVSALANALELIRMAGGDRPDLAATLGLAARQVEALARLADSLQDSPAPA